LPDESIAFQWCLLGTTDSKKSPAKSSFLSHYLADGARKLRVLSYTTTLKTIIVISSGSIVICWLLQEKSLMNPSLDEASEVYVNAEQAAKYLSISSKKLLALARSGRVPAHGIGDGQRRMWRFRLSELDNWMQSELTSGSDQGRIQERKNLL
jgi:excisionase family DNA binding protein